MKTWIDLTDGFPMKFDVERMITEVSKLENQDWLAHYDPYLSRGWRAMLLVSRHGKMSGPESQRPSRDFADFKRTPLVEELPYFRSILDYFKCPQGRVRILKLAPGAGIDIHRDIGAEVGCLAFNQVRLHVPIITNAKVTFFVGGERIRMQPGRFYYVNFSKAHYVRNDGSEARYHLVLDLKVNDWLRQYFPPTTRWEELEYFIARKTWPLFWALRFAWIQVTGKIWKAYEGSRAQSAVHWIKDRVGLRHSPFVDRK